MPYEKRAPLRAPFDGFSGTVVVTLTPPLDASKLCDDALWTALAVCGRWFGSGRSYHAPTATVIALQALTDALRADFPRTHGWKAPVPP